MSGPMNRMYGAAKMTENDEMSGRVNPAMEADDDLPIADVKRKSLIGGGGGDQANASSAGGTAPPKRQTAF